MFKIPSAFKSSVKITMEQINHSTFDTESVNLNNNHITRGEVFFLLLFLIELLF